MKNKILIITSVVLMILAFPFSFLSATTGGPVQVTSGWFGELAFDTTNNVWLVVSQAGYIDGRILDANQNPVGDAFSVSPPDQRDAAGSPLVAYSPDSGKFLVVWYSWANNILDVYARFVSSDKTMSDAYRLNLPAGSLLSSGSEKNSALEYDSRNHKFVLIWVNRGVHNSAMVTTINSSGTRGSIAEIIDDANGGIWNPKIAVNPDRNEYCAVYDMRNSQKWGMVPINASSLTIGTPSIVNNSKTATQIAYSTGADKYLVVSALYGGGTKGKFLDSCQNSNSSQEFTILPETGMPHVVYNSHSDTFGIIAQDQNDTQSTYIILDATGNQVDQGQLNLNAVNGQYVPNIAANPGDGSYGIISDKDYGATYFQASIGSGSVTTGGGPAPFASQSAPTAPTGYPPFGTLIAGLLTWSIRILGISVFVMIFYGGVLWFFSRGNSGEIEKAKSKIRNAVLGAILLLSSYLILRTINPDLVSGTFTLPGVSNAPTATTTTTVTPTTTPTTTATACQQNFSGLSASAGCSGSACVNVSNYTTQHDCSSNNGVCVLSAPAAARAQAFINAFNSISGSNSCNLKISSTIQANGGPSVSSCHKSGTPKSGTCADFNISNYNTCAPVFYQAAANSHSVVSFLDEYAAACRPKNATGGNIHVNF